MAADTNDQLATNFATNLRIEFKHQALPKHARNPKEIMFLTPEALEEKGYVLAKMGIESAVIDMITLISDDKSQEQATTPVRHFKLDFRNLLLRPKMEQIHGYYLTYQRRHPFLPPDQSFSEFDLAKLFCALNNTYGNQIEKMPELQHCIDTIFYDNKWIVHCQLIIFFLCFLLPYLVQLFWLDDNHFLLRVCNILLFATEIAFFLIELGQLNYLGAASYFSEFWNWIDMILFLIVLMYFCLRMSLPFDHQLPDKH